jgi:hypothetical protein
MGNDEDEGEGNPGDGVCGDGDDEEGGGMLMMPMLWVASKIRKPETRLCKRCAKA